jgi:hypothetical protein
LLGTYTFLKVSCDWTGFNSDKNKKQKKLCCPGQRFHWLGERCGCDSCWDFYLRFDRLPALSFSIVALGTGVQADISFFPELSLDDAPPPIPTPGIGDLRPAWLGGPVADGAASTDRLASHRRSSRKQVVVLQHLFCILPKWDDFFLELAFHNTVTLAIELAYSVEVKAPGLFSDEDWTELEGHHLAQFEAFLEREHWDKYSQDESLEFEDDIKAAVHGDVHFQFHLDGFRNWLRRVVLKNDESSQHTVFPHKGPGHLTRDELQFFSELRLGVLIQVGDVPPQTGLDITHAPSRLAGRVGVPTRHRDGGRRYFGVGDDSSDGGGDIDADADAVSGSDEGSYSGDADSDSSDWVDPYDCHY